MSGKSSQRKLGTTRGWLRRSRTAKAFGISRIAAKSGRAGEWGGWGRLSDDGLGQNNPDRSEDPWGAGCPGPILRCQCWPTFPDSELERKGGPADTKGGDKLDGHARMLGASLSAWAARQVPSDMHIFQPY